VWENVRRVQRSKRRYLLPKFWKNAILLSAALAVCGNLWAAAVAGLYEASVEVEDRTANSVAAGYSRALEQVLIRVTGYRRIEPGDGAHELLGSARSFVQQYRFLDDGQLWVRFDEDAVNARLVERGERLWGSERPETLMWLALDNGRGERALLGAEDVGDMPDLLRERAARRGLPLLLPLNDTADMQTLTFSDVWAGFDDKISEASERYGADAVLVGRAQLQQNRQWRVRWTLMMGATQAQALGGLEAGIDLAADRFAELFAVRGSPESGDLILTVGGIEEFAEYGAVASYLEQLSLVERLAVDEVSADGIRFRLSLRAEPEMLERTIGLGTLLESDPSPDMSGSVQSLRYRYRR
jgi:hypothetical protein